MDAHMSHQTDRNTSTGSGLYIGLMSGTSMDGVDAVLARFEDGGQSAYLGCASAPFPSTLKSELLALNRSGPDEIHRSALASLALAEIYADAVHRLLKDHALDPLSVRAIGAHGQTVRHQPSLGYTTQLNAPAVLAERTGIAVVSDFRSRDIAAGGQGAPLVPAFHAALFAAEKPRVILNLGGIANITCLAPGKAVTGFDTGPANVLLDAWCQRHTGQDYDADGAWAASGRCDADLLEYLISSEPWLRGAPPKSTGRDLFNMPWLLERLDADAVRRGYALAAEDIQATLSAFTARTIADAIANWATPPSGGIWVAGGGAANPTLLRDIEHATDMTVRSTDGLGVPAQALEAYAFAWLAYAHCHDTAGNRPEVTGAAGMRVLGSYTPA